MSHCAGTPHRRSGDCRSLDPSSRTGDGAVSGRFEMATRDGLDQTLVLVVANTVLQYCLQSESNYIIEWFSNITGYQLTTGIDTGKHKPAGTVSAAVASSDLQGLFRRLSCQ